ncbi:MAG: DUF4124 domain-containing protein [Gammaproteobacteria bacterium]|nr:DUF4124 domain-containing protein [Gammaproteobacteria bacterium]MDH5799802.1 DUF4124 domain-containing protein [Gammaproteobacteria bacterium]
MKLRNLISSCLIACLFCAPAMAVTVYKWVDENGVVHYSQRPVNKAAKSMKLKVQRPSADSDSAANSELQEQAPASEDKKSKKPKDEVAWEKQQAEMKKKNCETATQHHASLAAGGRLYEMKDGERHYLDDSARQAKLAVARENMNKWCN